MNTARIAARWAAAPGVSRSGRRALRRCAGLAIVAGGALYGARQLALAYPGWDVAVRGALNGGLLAAAATAVGTLPVAWSRQVSARSTSVMLGFGAGVMLAASVFSLLVPALAQARSQGASAAMAAVMVSAGMLLGAALILSLGRLAPEVRHPGASAPQARAESAIRRAWLFAAAITLHNVPEGLAIGVAFAGLDHPGAVGLATGIGIQDLPEGLAVALALRASGYGRTPSVLYGIGSGVVEPVFAVLGAALVTTFAPLLLWGLAAAAGAMLFVIASDVIPETHRDGHGRSASVALMVGFVVMLVLDTALA